MQGILTTRRLRFRAIALYFSEHVGTKDELREWVWDHLPQTTRKEYMQRAHDDIETTDQEARAKGFN